MSSDKNVIPQSPDILIGIVTFNRVNTLVESINAHLLDGAIQSDIIVINNASEDGTAEAVRTRFPEVQLVNLQENAGSAGGFSEAMEESLRRGYDYLWLYNDDSRPLPGAREVMLKALAKLCTENVGLLKMGMTSQGLSEAHFWKGRRITKWIPMGEEPIRTDLITFDGCLISVPLIREIGTCNPKFFMGIYEFDFCLRASDKQYSIFTLPMGLIHDQKMGSAKGAPFWRQYYVTRNHLFFALQRHSLQTFIAFLGLETKKVYSILFLQKDSWRKLRFKGKAILDGLRGNMGRTVEPVIS